MGNAFSGDTDLDLGEDQGDSLTVGMSIDEIEQLSAPDQESHLARLKRLTRREKVLEVFKSVTFGTVLGQYTFLLFFALVLLIGGLPNPNPNPNPNPSPNPNPHPAGAVLTLTLTLTLHLPALRRARSADRLAAP
jgi:hypothetical protein